MFYSAYVSASQPASHHISGRPKNTTTARILHARLAWHVHAICPFSCTILHNLAPILARSWKKVQETPNLQVIILAASLAKSCTISCKNRARLCKNRARLCKNRARLCKKRDISRARAKQVLHARFLQDSCMILQVRVCWEHCG